VFVSFYFDLKIDSILSFLFPQLHFLSGTAEQWCQAAADGGRAGGGTAARPLVLAVLFFFYPLG
jgi:hypothetical protein